MKVGMIMTNSINVLREIGATNTTSERSITGAMNVEDITPKKIDRAEGIVIQKSTKKNDRPRRRHSRSRSRSPSSSISRHSSCSEHSYYDRKKARESFSRSRSPSRLSPSERRSGESRHRKRKVKRSRSRSPSREEDGHDFANVDEARAIMDKLERRRLERETEKR